MLDASSGGTLLFLSYEEGYKLIESITANTYQWKVKRDVVISTQKKPAGIHVVIETTSLAFQVAHIHQMIKNMMTTPDVPAVEYAKIVIETLTVSCLYYGRAHLSEDFSMNHVSANYMGNKKYNKPINNNYNPGWCNHPNFS